MKGRWTQVSIFLLPRACSDPSFGLIAHPQTASKHGAQAPWFSVSVLFSILLFCLQLCRAVGGIPSEMLPLEAETLTHPHPLLLPHAKEGGVARTELSGSSS